MKSTKSKEVKPSSLYLCSTCNQTEAMEHSETMKHLTEVHGIEVKGLKVSKNTLAHIDGDTWFSWRYEIKIPSDKGEVVLQNETISPRAKDDMMRYQ